VSDTAPRAAKHTTPDSLDDIEGCYRRAWTDGLPILRIIADRVQAMMEAARLETGDVLGQVPVRRRTLPAELVSANAVAAGCLSAYFAIDLATLRVLFGYDLNCIHEVSAATNSTGLLVAVNGPIRREIELNCTDHLFIPGHRANSTIGRALRLIFIDLFEQQPSVLDHGCMGSLTRFAVVIVKDEENSPWEPFHISQGYLPQQSTVIVTTIQDPSMHGNRYGIVESLWDSIAAKMSSHGLGLYFGRGIEWAWFVGHLHSELLGRLGWKHLDTQGIPPWTIIAAVFANTAHTYTLLMVVADFPYLMCPRPIANVSREGLHLRAQLLTLAAFSLLIHDELAGPRTG
jgi:hypothetical protein